MRMSLFGETKARQSKYTILNQKPLTNVIPSHYNENQIEDHQVIKITQIVPRHNIKISPRID